MPKYYAVKSPRSFLWSRQIDHDEVMAWFLEQRIERDWLICPHGEANLAVSVGEFIDTPGILATKLREQKSRIERKAHLAKTLAQPAIRTFGRRLMWLAAMGFGFGCPLACVGIIFLDHRNVVGPALMTIIVTVTGSAFAVGATLYLAGFVIHHLNVGSAIRAEDSSGHSNDISFQDSNAE